MPGGPGTPTTQIEVLEAVVARIRSQLEQFDEDNLCFLSVDPDPCYEVFQPQYITVAPAEGGLDDGIFDGSGSTNELSAVEVTVWSQVKLDREGADVEMLETDDRGLLVIKRQILRALSRHMLLDPEGNMILVRPMRLLHAAYPKHRNDDDRGNISMTFSTDFIWDLTADDE